jgi:filamentous hemagglutinin family protein
MIFPWLQVQPSLGQSITPATDGVNTIINATGQDYTITGGTQAGNNLFHSFDQFGLNSGERANFATGSDIGNVLGRVTGGNASLIDGLIQVSGSNANLFLINPAGVFFGANAQLNVPGDFTAASATGIGFDQGWFNAVGDNDYASLVGNPNQFFFSETNGSVANFGNLGVGSGNHLVLLGSTVLNLGNLSAPEGQVTVMAVPANNVVRLSQAGMVLNLELEPQGADQLLALPSLPDDFTPLQVSSLLTGGNFNHASSLQVNDDGTLALSGSGLSFSGDAGLVVASGNINVSSTVAGLMGGTAHVLGDRVAVLGGTIDARGSNGGGTILIGGDYQGNGIVPNANLTFVDDSARIFADATLNGNGGNVIVWADDTTQFFGHIGATGGVNGGNGGLAEVSGKNVLTFQGLVDLTAPNGHVGTLLLDPTDINITVSSDSGLATTGLLFTGSGDTANLSTATLQSQLALSNVTVSTASSGSRSGGIGVMAPITWSSGNTLTLEADRNIQFFTDFFNSTNPAITTTGSADATLVLKADRSIDFLTDTPIQATGTGQLNLIFNADADNTGRGNIAFEGTINSNGGDITFGGGTDPSTQPAPGDSGDFPEPGISLSGATINAGGGNILMNGQGFAGAGGNGALPYGIQIRSSTLTTSGSGTITLNGTGGSDAAANNNHGIFITQSSEISTTGNGDITLQGTGGTGPDSNHGIAIDRESSITTVDGNINLTGIGVNSSSAATSVGIQIANIIPLPGIPAFGSPLSNTIQSTGTGNILLQGTGANGAVGLDIQDTQIIATGTGNITLIGNEINISNPASQTTRIQGTQTLQLQPLTIGFDIALGGSADSGTSVLDLTATELAFLANGFNQILVGRSDGSGPITLGTGFTLQDPTTLQGSNFTLQGGNTATTFTLTGTQAGQITNGGITFTDNGSLSFTGLGSLNGNSGGDSLNGTAGNNAFIVTGNDQGTIQGISFSGIENLVGGASDDTVTFQAGARFSGNLNGNGGTLTLLGDEIDIGGSIAGTGLLQIQPTATTQAIRLGGTDSGSTSTLDFTTSELAGLQDGFSSIVIGRSDGSGLITLGSDVSFRDPVTLQSPGGAIDLSGGTVTNSGNSTTVTALNTVTTGNIDTSLASGTGGDIALTSQTSSITTGDLNSSGTTGGNITVQASTAITTGTIDSSGSEGDGGDVLLDPTGDIQVTSINAQGGDNGTGGNVDIETTGGFFRALGSFTDRNNILASISTAGGNGGGFITIRHTGDSLTPFRIGLDGAADLTNGTVGSITTGERTLLVASLSETFSTGPVGVPPEINIITPFVDVADPGGCPPDCEDVQENVETNEVSLELDASLDPIRPYEAGFTPDYTSHLAINQPDLITLPEAQQVLQQVFEATGQTTGIIYINFAPTQVTAPPQVTVDSPTANITATSAIASLPADSLVSSLEKDLLAPSIAPESHSKSQTKGDVPPPGMALGDASGVATSRIAPQVNVAQASTTRSNPLLKQGTDILEIMVVTPSGEPILVRNPQATRSRVLQLAQLLRNEVSKPSSSNRYQRPAQRLYEWLVEPLEAELVKQGVALDTMVFSPAAGLRSLPFATLYDGDQFLVEKYSVGLMPSLSLVDTRYQDVRDVQILAMGASEFADQTPLPTVPIEIETIIQQLWQGKGFLNQDFTYDTLQSQRRQTPYGIIHLATHADIVPGAIRNSYIQLYDRRLSLHEIRNLQWSRPTVEMLVLSACRTALGNEDAELGFAGLAVKTGVKTAVASLWYVNDTATTGLMTKMYQALGNPEEAPIKAEALRQAQLALLRGEVTIEGNSLRGIRGDLDQGLELPAASVAGLANAQLQHPYYWAGFTMIGSPW